jgi:hypothetical protein
VVLILFDTNIFIDLLGGCHQASAELNSYPEPAISAITLMELRAGEIARPANKPILDALLQTFTVFPIDWEITDKAIAIRGQQPGHATQDQAARCHYWRDCGALEHPGGHAQPEGLSLARRALSRSIRLRLRHKGDIQHQDAIQGWATAPRFPQVA